MDAGVVWAKGLFIAEILVTILQCQPVSDFWNRFAPTAKGPFHCGVNVNQFFDGNSIPNIVTDAALLVLPIPFIWQLHLPKAQKLGLTSIFILGILILRSLLHRSVNILSACLPSLRPLLSLVLYGSIERPQRHNPANSKPLGGPAAQAYNIWDSHPKSHHVGRGNNASEMIDQKSKSGFARLSDGGHKEGTYISATDIALDEMQPDQGIQVRTDVYVDGQVKR
ncbi:MAG: hypothetical protein L6R42_001713 [Xanthoria sp. 1 TBL-2021]|nr:MAG: hypothetical protein L6R42_001713 [Xanthoria sp. 1 TBL-2021]